MSLLPDQYFYDQQLRSYVLQFMAVFSGMQVMVGKLHDREPGLITVPIHYGHPDRVSAAIVAGNTQNSPLSLPVMSAYLSSISMSPADNHGAGTERVIVRAPMGGVIPDDVKTYHQVVPVPYRIEIDLNLLASNSDQHFQMLEQILPFFNPSIQLQTSDKDIDWKRIITLNLDNIRVNNNYPIGTENRIIQSTITFSFIGRLAVPVNVKEQFVQEVLVRIGMLNPDSPYSITEQLNQQDAPYQVMGSSDWLDFN